MSKPPLETIWNFLTIKDKPSVSDFIFAFGSQDKRVPERTAELYLEKYSPLILVSGGRGPFTQSNTHTEAQQYFERLINMGVPQAAIVLEEKASNTGENIEFGMRLLVSLRPETVILIGRQFMMRRIKATFKKQFPNIKSICCPSNIGFVEYVAWMDEKQSGRAASRLLAELERLRTFTTAGYMVAVEIPDNVFEAERELIAALG